ncbi:hypothetical protein GCM10009589_28340 [Arthrobacter pascens]
MDICCDTADWVMYMRWAAAVNEPTSDTAAKIRKRLKSSMRSALTHVAATQRYLYSKLVLPVNHEPGKATLGEDKGLSKQIVTISYNISLTRCSAAGRVG